MIKYELTLMKWSGVFKGIKKTITDAQLSQATKIPTNCVCVCDIISVVNYINKKLPQDIHKLIVFVN